MTKEEAIKYAKKKLKSADYRLEMGYLNNGLRQIVSNEFEFYRQALSALRAQQEQERNDPLNLDELRQMDGEPVWLNIAGGVWGLVDTSDFVAWLDRGGFVALDRLSGKVYRCKPEEGTV